MNQGKLGVVKKEMARMNIDILGISELKWIRMNKFNIDGCYIYYCGQESLRRNGIALIVNKRVWNAIFRWNLKNDIMICLFPSASLIAQLVKNLPAMWETWIWSLVWEDPLEKGKATNFSILTWRISYTV